MAHITLSIPDPVYSEMKKHPEIKWSEIARQSIIEKALVLKGSMHSKDILMLLPPETQKQIQEVPGKEWRKFTEGVRKAGWKRTKYLTQA